MHHHAYDALRKPLQPPYDSPYEVLNHDKKHFTLIIKGQKEVVSIDRLKPAYLDVTPTESDSPNSVSIPQTPPPNTTVSDSSSNLSLHHTTTRSGRQVCWSIYHT